MTIRGQARIPIETAAVTLVFERIDATRWRHVSSEMAEIEIEAMADTERQQRVGMLLPGPKSIMRLTKAILDRAAELEKRGFKPADAVHVAAAERAKADVLLSCGDRFCRLAKRHRRHLQVQVANPVD